MPAPGTEVDVGTEPVESPADELSMISGSSMKIKGAKTMLSKKY